jgi:Uma2 family endonuclease
MSTAPSLPILLTAEQFSRRPDPGYPEELVRGRIITMPPTKARHGQVCSRVDRLLGNFADKEDLGHVLSNDAGVVTERGPDTVRGPDVSFYSYAKLPKGPLPQSYPDVVPDFVVEVLSPDDRWPAVLAKVAEFLNAGIASVLVLEPELGAIYVYRADRAVEIVRGDELLMLEDLPGFSVPASRFFE